MSTSSQYYAYVDNVDAIVKNIVGRFCQSKDEHCLNTAEKLFSAASLDVDYDTISRAVVLTAVWPNAPETSGWSEETDLPHEDATVEIGVLSHEANADPEDIQFGGFLTVLGQDDTPSLFSSHSHLTFERN